MVPGPDAHRRNMRALVALAFVASAFVGAYALVPEETGARDLFSDAALLVVSAVSAVFIFAAAKRRGAWSGTPAYAFAMLALALSRAVSLIDDLGGEQMQANRFADLGFLAIGAMFLIAARVQFHDHFDREDRREIFADVSLISIALISIVYLILRPADPGEAVAALAFSALFAATAAAAITAFLALALWLPSGQHIGQLTVVGVFAGTTLALGSLWIRGEEIWGAPTVDIPLGLATLLLAGLMVSEPLGVEHHQHQARGGWGRPVLTTLAVLAGAVSLGTVASAENQGTTTIPESTVLIVVLAFAVAARILVNQVRGRQAADTAESALSAKQSALEEADEAMVKLQDAIQTVAASEERLRLLFDAAVDGIVEIDSDGAVRRANEAFCQMVGLEREFLVGRSWADAMSSASGVTDGLVELPETGHATIARGGHEVFLEARTSDLPASGRLMLVRDVTAAKVADQTIRSLFKFLQDRDEDRSRLIKRTNAAIEAERNRIARDLHDGPVQGVSAASLSLEAVLLMIKSGDLGGANELLIALREQLSEEADSLRRLMSNLRPPILEERGLIPALQETLARFGKDNHVHTHFKSRALVDVPPDLETLAYRLVQEALTNAHKHAGAAEVTLTVDAVAGQLRIEVADDGIGFDPAKARDYLRAGKVGLASMRERIELANGTFLIRSAPSGGTTIVATLPLDTIPATLNA